MGGGRADRAGPEPGPDPVGGRLRHQTRLPRGIDAELFGDLAGGDQILAAQRESGQPAPLETRGVRHLVGEQTQVVLTGGRARSDGGSSPTPVRWRTTA